MYGSVNVTLDPGLKDRLFDGSLTTYRCEGCGHAIRVRHQLLYHDMARKLMIQLYPGSDPPEQLARELGTALTAALGEAEMAEYTLRVVRTTEALIEKARAFADGLDDCTLEAAKLFIASAMPELRAATLHYTQSEPGNRPDRPGETLLKLHVEGLGGVAELPMSSHFYDAAAEAYPDLIEETRERRGEWLEVNGDFVLDYLTTQESQEE
jgi:hypothetical protein